MKPNLLGGRKGRSGCNERMHFNFVTLTLSNTWCDSRLHDVCHTHSHHRRPRFCCRPLIRPSSRQRQALMAAPTSHCPTYCDAPPHLRHRSPVAAALKRLLPKRSVSPRVRGHPWPPVSPATARQSPKTLHPLTHQSVHAHFFFLSLHCEQSNPAVSE